ncbi:MAG: hypothetical protein EON98_11570, partial [Chitinophagaceae bacterium]
MERDLAIGSYLFDDVQIKRSANVKIQSPKGHLTKLHIKGYLVRIKFIMESNGPVIIIEDDSDDKEMLDEVFQKLGYGNQLLFFTDGQQALDFLNSSDVVPFLILSD